MAHGIQKNDKGYVWGETWHKHPNYVTVERPITYEEAYGVLDYPVEKVQNYINVGGKEVKVEDSYTLVRTDTNTPILSKSVGKKFVVLPNTDLLDNIDTMLLKPFAKEGLVIESVGTLWGGQTNFINIALDKFHVKGDQSETLSRLLYYNSIGVRAYAVCAHTIRVVCNNTANVALVQGVANATLTRFAHTISAGEKIAKRLVDLAELKMGLKAHYEILNTMALQPISSRQITTFFDQFLPLPKEDGREMTIAVNKRNEIKDVFEKQDGFEKAINRSKYAFFSAITYWYDHAELNRGNDEASRTYAGIVGPQAQKKLQAFDLINSI